VEVFTEKLDIECSDLKRFGALKIWGFGHFGGLIKLWVGAGFTPPSVAIDNSLSQCCWCFKKANFSGM